MKKKEIFIITGLAGSGKTTAIKVFEDSNFYCVDNMPIDLLPHFFEIISNEINIKTKYAFVMDLRTQEFLNKYEKIFNDLGKNDYQFKILFFTAKEEVLIKRYSETRRKHPLHKTNLLDALKKEKKALLKLQKMADEVIDTSNLTTHQLKSRVAEIVSEKDDIDKKMKITIASFGFKYGIPYDVNNIVDVRFITNPFFIPELKNLTGKDEKVVSYILEDKRTELFLKQYKTLLNFLIPEYKKEGKSYLKIAIGCTGGVHRSVAIAENIYDDIKKNHKNIEIKHRDIDK